MRVAAELSQTASQPPVRETGAGMLATSLHLTALAIGNTIGGRSGNRLAGALIGATVGGLAGNRIGAALDNEHKRRAYAAQMQALETGPSGAPVA